MDQESPKLRDRFVYHRTFFKLFVCLERGKIEAAWSQIVDYTMYGGETQMVFERGKEFRCQYKKAYRWIPKVLLLARSKLSNLQ